MKVFLIIPTLKQGGAERVISELASQFSKYGVEVHLVLLAKAEDFYIVNSNVTVHRLGFVNKGRLQKIHSEFQVFIALRKLLKKHRPDGVLSFMDKYNIFTILASRFLNLRVFVSDRSNPKLKLSSSLHMLKKLTYRYATGIIAQTSLAKKTLEEFTGNKNVQIIPNPLKEVQIFTEIKRQKIILNVGRLVPEKGQNHLIQAFYKLKENNWKLVILGDGPLRADLEKQVIALGLSDKVEMLGAVDDVDKWLARASIFAFSSISEGFPNALIEAMAAGLPCVSFDCDAGPRDIIKNKINGILVNVEDVQGLTKQLSILMNDELLRERLGSNATSIRKKLCIEKIASDYLSLITNKKN